MEKAVDYFAALGGGAVHNDRSRQQSTKYVPSVLCHNLGWVADEVSGVQPRYQSANTTFGYRSSQSLRRGNVFIVIEEHGSWPCRPV